MLKMEESEKDIAILSFKIGSVGFLFNMLIEGLRGINVGLNNFFIPNLCRTIRIILSSLFMALAVFYYQQLHQFVQQPVELIQNLGK